MTLDSDVTSLLRLEVEGGARAGLAIQVVRGRGSALAETRPPGPVTPMAAEPADPEGE